MDDLEKTLLLLSALVNKNDTSVLRRNIPLDWVRADVSIAARHDEISYAPIFPQIQRKKHEFCKNTSG